MIAGQTPLLRPAANVESRVASNDDSARAAESEGVMTTDRSRSGFAKWPPDTLAAFDESLPAVRRLIATQVTHW